MLGLAQAYARTAYACFDQPDLKAEFTFRLTVPAHWTVLSSQPAAGVPASASTDWKIIRSAPANPLAPPRRCR
ncbi:MAG: hypothetical protein ACRDOH_11825 [Streptosporangiaceae bacterium]